MSRGFAVSVPSQVQVALEARAVAQAADGGDRKGLRRAGDYNGNPSNSGSARSDIGARVPLRHLIPLMDTFNHDDSATSSVHYATDGTRPGEFVLTTHDNWEAGEEVFIHYGHFTPAEFLTGYGFVPESGTMARKESCSNSATQSQQNRQERDPARRGAVAPTIDFSGGLSVQGTSSGATCGGTSRCRKLKSSFLCALGSHALELTAPHCLLHLANRSKLEAVIARSHHALQDGSHQDSLAATAAADAIDVGESRDGDFEMFVLDMITEELQGRQRMYGSTLEQDKQEQQKRARRQQQGMHLYVGRDGGLSIDALLSLLIAEKQVLRQCEDSIAEAVMRAKLRKIGIK
jgi:hypothetical protein